MLLQKELRLQINDLKDSVKHKWVKWSAWELEFIESLVEKLGDETIELSSKQHATMLELYDRI